MNSANATIGSLIANNEIGKKQTKAIGKSGAVTSLKKALGENVKFVGWPVIQKEVINRVSELLDIKLKDILGGAWSKAKGVHAAMQNSKQKPADTFLVPLAEHTIKSIHRPAIEIEFNEKKIGDITFEINLSLKIKGGVLKIVNGTIKGIASGSYQAKGELKLEKIKIIEFKSKELDLPGYFGD